MTKTEENYAQIEKELLSIVFGVEKFETYLYGKKVVVETVHKPLETIFKKSLPQAITANVAASSKIKKFDLEVKYKKGTTMYL